MDPEHGDLSHMELEDSPVGQHTSNLANAPLLPPPAAEMLQFTREIRVVDHIPESSIGDDNASSPAFKRQRPENSMELTGIQNFVPVSTPFQKAEFNFELPKISSNVLDTNALDAAFGHEDEDDQTVELQVYVDPDEEPPKKPDSPPARKPLAPKPLSPVQEVTEESSGIQVINAPTTMPQIPRSPVIGSSHTAPVRRAPATPRHGIQGHHRMGSQHGSQHQSHVSGTPRAGSMTPSKNGRATPSTSRRASGRSGIQATPTRLTTAANQQQTPRKPQVIIIPSSPDRYEGSPRRFLSDDESFLNVDPDRLESVDDLMVNLAIKDFNPTSVEAVLPAKEVQLVGLTPEQEIIALTLQGEIDRLISEGQSLETQLKKYTEKMDIRAIMARYQTYGRQDRLQLKHRVRNVYDHLQAKSEVKTAEGELEAPRQMLDKLKELQATYDKRHADFASLRQESKDVEQEIKELRDVQGDEATLDREIQQLKKEVDAMAAKLKSRENEVTKRACENEALEEQWSQAPDIHDLTKESPVEAWHRRQYIAKLETLKSLPGIIDIKMWSDGANVILDGLEIISYRGENELRFKMTGYTTLLTQHYFNLLKKFDPIKDNLAIWKRYMTVNSQLKQLRRRHFNKWVQESKDVLLFKLFMDQERIHVQFSKSNITIEWLDLKDKSLEAQALKLSGENAIALLTSKLCR